MRSSNISAKEHGLAKVIGKNDGRKTSFYECCKTGQRHSFNYAIL